MKKKLTLIILALACAMTCAFALVACGSGGGGEDGKTLTGLVIVDIDGKEYTEYDMGNIVYGGTPGLNAYRLVAKYSDNSYSELAKDAEGVTVSYAHDYDTISSLPATYSVGQYTLTYSYKNYIVSATFKIVTSADASPYVLDLDATSWQYKAQPEVTVTEGGAAVTDYTLYYITTEKYNQIRYAADFAEKLKQNSESYNALTAKPGTYYLFAYVNKTYANEFNSNFKSVTITKGNVAPSTEVGALTASYTYGSTQPGKTGKITLADVDIINNIYGLPYALVDANGNDVYGSWEWAVPTMQLDSNNDGTVVSIKFVADESDCYNEFVLTNAVTINISKGRVDIPELDSVWTTYDGDEHDVILTHVTDWNRPYIKVTRNSQPVTIGESDPSGKAYLGKFTDEGEYLYVIELLDKVNFFWSVEDWSDTTDTADRQVTYTIEGRASFVVISGEHTIDENLQVRIKLEQGTDSYDPNTNISPYVAGSLQASVLPEYEYSNGTKAETKVDATVTIENDGKNDYIVITVSAFKDEVMRNYGRLLLKITATGADHYKNIDWFAENLDIKKYTGQITCPIEEGQVIEEPKTATILEFFKLYPTLRTKLGEWKVYMIDSNGGRWALGDEATLGSAPQDEITCVLVFESHFVHSDIADRVKEVTFKFRATD